MFFAEAMHTKIKHLARLPRIPPSQSVATTEMGGEKRFNLNKQVKGRKRHLLVDTLGLVLFVVVCAASIADSDGAGYIFHGTEGRFPRLHTILVDQGYKGWLVELAKRWFGISDIYLASIQLMLRRLASSPM